MKSTLGQFYFCFTTKDDPKEEGSRKRKGNLLIPKNPEGYTFTTDTEKQKELAKEAAAFVKQLTESCKAAAVAEFGSTKGVNWNRVVDGDVDEKRPGFWEVRAKTQYTPQMVGPTGKPIPEDEAESKFKNGNWGKIYFKEPKAFSGGGKNKSTSLLLEAIQFGYEGTLPAGASSGGSVVEFDALPEQEIQDGDFDTDEDQLDDLE